MTGVEQLLSEYKAAHQVSADADPRAFLARAPSGEREQLAGLIDAYLERAPRRESGAAALRDSPAAVVAESVHRSLAGSAGLWPTLLPRLRNQARLRRAEVVSELAARLGAQGQQDKVASYYHQMEQGLLPETGVSDTVLEALGRIVGYSREALRKAGQMPAAGGAPAGSAPVFARTKPADGELEPPAAAAPTAQWDEVDRLFRGG